MSRFFRYHLSIVWLVYINLFTSLTIKAESFDPKTSTDSLEYKKPFYISDEVWAAMQPYFLPYSHPLRKKLDTIFTQNRVLTNKTTLEQAGFTNTKAGKFSHMIVSKHPKLKNTFLKMMTDDSPFNEWRQLKKRVEAARNLKKILETLKANKYFTVPEKWIYPLPAEVPPEKDSPYPKGFVLIAENMHVVNRKLNKKLWRTRITEKKLDLLFQILSLEGLSDSVYPFNVPFTKEGKIAFIDLEHYHSWPVHYYKLTPYLKEKKQLYWNDLIRNASF